jgi:tRNA-modifying protein YgfZ
MTAFLEEHGARLQNGRCLSFGDPGAEFAALDGAVLVPLLAVTPLRLSGPDRLDFLHGQVSNEVKRLKEGETNTSLLLNVKGHALAELQLCRREDDLYAAVEDGAGGFVQEHFKRHIIFDQVEVEDLSGAIATLTLQGEGAGAVLSRSLNVDPPQPGRFVQPGFASAKVLVLAKRRSLPGGYDLHVLTRDAEELFNVLKDAGAVPTGEEALEVSRIPAGLPPAANKGGEGVLPQEAGLHFAVSYTKGCYLGQEIMARIEARGNVRRKLAGLRYDTLPQGEDRELFLGDKIVGRRGNAVHHPCLGPIGLAVLRTDLDPSASLTVGGATASQTALPFNHEGA